ncbi:hypothetical protein C9374_001091 [Naegleria lovaniensis]|uniref:Uncharacterized protein n=1 Tax=Naegleria lovaniensis TaxID=51637 RepID=A0AA88GV02_NAELO|nr:uncharacterized protein C9374_001091 [Naegleria lovaniensis]KAG2387497.1 hypothetical protein C9374_001091 [Naegleria lovaniensis]
MFIKRVSRMSPVTTSNAATTTTTGQGSSRSTTTTTNTTRTYNLMTSSKSSFLKQQGTTNTIDKMPLKKPTSCTNFNNYRSLHKEQAYRNTNIMECQIPLPYMMEKNHPPQMALERRNNKQHNYESSIMNPSRRDKDVAINLKEHNTSGVVNPFMSARSECKSLPRRHAHPRQDMSVKRFISHSATHSLLKKEDVVLVNVDEDLSILNMVDATWHGQTGVVCEINDDECVVEIAEKSVMFEDDHDSNVFTTCEGFVHESHCMLLVGDDRNEEYNDHAVSIGQTRQIVLPIFCLCLEDKVLKERLAASLKSSSRQQSHVSSPKVMQTILQTQSKSLVSCLS